MSDRPTVLVVDDSQAFLMYLSILLNRMNLEVLPVACAEEAIELARLTRPQVMTLDMVMPGMDGMTALRTIRADAELADLPVIMISSYQDKNSQWEAMSLGCIDVLDKPVELRRLHNALQRCDFYREGRRRYLRTSYVQPVLLTHNGTTRSCNSISLSERGIFVRMREPLAKGTEVDITLSLPDGGSLKVGGRVLYAKGLNGGKFVIPPGVAIKFDRMTLQDAEVLQRVVAELLIGDLVAEQEDPILKSTL